MWLHWTTQVKASEHLCLCTGLYSQLFTSLIIRRNARLKQKKQNVISVAADPAELFIKGGTD